jgi:hypothetical protein
MSYIVERLGNKPVIVITLQQPFNHEETHAIHRDTAEAASVIDGTVYRIVDTSTLDWSYDDMLDLLEDQARKRASGMSEGRFRSFYVVGEDYMSQLQAERIGHEHYDILRSLVVASMSKALAIVDKLQAQAAETLYLM